jgi:hypothetical protein
VLTAAEQANVIEAINLSRSECGRSPAPRNGSCQPFDDTLGRDVLVAMSDNALDPRLLGSPAEECFCRLGGVSTVPEVGMDSVAELDLPLGARVPLKAAGADDGSAFSLDEEPDAYPSSCGSSRSNPA